MAQHKASDSPLVAAARALDRALDDFAINADQIRRAPLTTQQQIDKVRERLTQASVAEATVRAHIATLEQAIQTANATRATQATHIAERTPHIDARALELQELLDAYIALGVRLTQSDAGSPDLTAIADETEALLATAKRLDYPEIVRLSEVLTKQIAAKSRA